MKQKLKTDTGWDLHVSSFVKGFANAPDPRLRRHTMAAPTSKLNMSLFARVGPSGTSTTLGDFQFHSFVTVFFKQHFLIHTSWSAAVPG